MDEAGRPYKTAEQQVYDYVRQSDSPVSWHDIEEAFDLSRKTAQTRLKDISHRSGIHYKEAGRTTVWWHSEEAEQEEHPGGTTITNLADIDQPIRTESDEVLREIAALRGMWLHDLGQKTRLLGMEDTASLRVLAYVDAREYLVDSIVRTTLDEYVISDTGEKPTIPGAEEQSLRYVMHEAELWTGHDGTPVTGIEGWLEYDAQLEELLADETGEVDLSNYTASEIAEHLPRLPEIAWAGMLYDNLLSDVCLFRW